MPTSFSLSPSFHKCASFGEREEKDSGGGNDDTVGRTMSRLPRASAAAGLGTLALSPSVRRPTPSFRPFSRLLNKEMRSVSSSTHIDCVLPWQERSRRRWFVSSQQVRWVPEPESFLHGVPHAAKVVDFPPQDILICSSKDFSPPNFEFSRHLLSPSCSILAFT